MSITLDVEEYCSNCERFDPKKEDYTFSNFDQCDAENKHYITVKCKYKEECASMYKYLMGVVKNE